MVIRSNKSSNKKGDTVCVTSVEQDSGLGPLDRLASVRELEIERGQPFEQAVMRVSLEVFEDGRSIDTDRYCPQLLEQIGDVCESDLVGAPNIQSRIRPSAVWRENRQSFQSINRLSFLQDSLPDGLEASIPLMQTLPDSQTKPAKQFHRARDAMRKLNRLQGCGM